MDVGGASVLWTPVCSQRDIPIKSWLQAHFGVPTFVANDCNMIALALNSRHPEKYGENFAAVLLAEGVGMGLFLRNRIVNGTRSSGVEFGHMTYVPGGATCRCGNRGCIEAYAGDYAIARHASGSPDDTPPSSLFDAPDLGAIGDAARAGDEMALGAIEAAGAAIGTGLASLYALVDRFPVVLVGRGTEVFDLMETAIRAALGKAPGESPEQRVDIDCYLDERPLVREGCAISALVVQGRDFGRATQSNRGCAVKHTMEIVTGMAVVAAAILCASIASGGDAPWSERNSVVGSLKQVPSGMLAGDDLQQLVDVGGALFGAKFTALDGAGRPGATQAIIPTKARNRAASPFARLAGPDSLACASCHNDPAKGGAGDFVTNVFVSEGFSNADFDTSDPQFSNERGTNHLFGAGLVELLAREMSADLSALRDRAIDRAAKVGEPVKVALVTKGVAFGHLTAHPDGLVNLSEIEGIDTDLVIRPFSQKGVIASLRQFTVNAMNHHHGMQAVERFGSRWTRTADFDEDGIGDEIDIADISALVAWQATLPAPAILDVKNAVWRRAASAGAALFADFGCGACHMEALPLRSLSFQDPGPFDSAGTLNRSQVADPAIYDLSTLEWAKSLQKNGQGEILVPLFGDLKRHKMTDRSIDALGNELLSQRFVGRDIFMTAELWGLASTSPYGHRNDFTTLDGIILAHGGEGRAARDKYEQALPEQRSAIIAYLKTLVIEP